MLMSLALIFLSALPLGGLFQKLRLPGLLGMLLAGIVLGTLGLIDGSILGISAQLRQIALIIILMRAGLSLHLRDLKKVGRVAILMCFVPACFEIAAVLLFAPPLLGITLPEAAVMGSVLAAVSPAVIVPRMLQLMETGYGTEKSIPQLIMAGASVDDVFVIVLFTAFTSYAADGQVSWLQFAGIPLSIVLGVLAGSLCGGALSWLFKKVHMRDSVKVILLLSLAFLLVSLENADILPFSGLLAVMAAGIALLRFYPALAARISTKFSKLWIAAEILLFVLVGAAVDLQYARTAGVKVILLIFIALLFRMAGVFACLVRSPLTMKERLFCMLAYTPKATVQAAIGGVPLAMGLPCGQLVLTAAVLSILITAPLGAFGVDLTHEKLLERQEDYTR